MKKRLVIDPGHDGKAVGVVHDGVMEKDATLATALTLKWVLVNELDVDFDVILTRTDDRPTPLHRRIAIPATLFFSVHYDIPHGGKPIYHQKRCGPSTYVAYRLSILTGGEHPVWSTRQAAHTGGRLFIDDAHHPAVLWEVDTIDKYRPEREYRLMKARPMARALVEVMKDLEVVK